MGRNSGGVLAIIAASLSLYIGIAMLSPALAGESAALAIGVLEFLVFAFGLIAGVFALKGRRFHLVMAGTAFTTVAGCALLFSAIVLRPHLTSFVLLLFGILISILAALATIWIVRSRKEFTL